MRLVQKAKTVVDFLYDLIGSGVLNRPGAKQRSCYACYMGFSENYGPLLVTDYIVAPDI